MSRAPTTTIKDCQKINLPKIERPNGNISPIYSGINIPFRVARVYYLYDIPGGSFRGGHAHKELEQLIIAIMGSFDAVFDDGRNRKKITLNRAYFGIYVLPGIWRELENFSSGANCLVLASHPYDEGDYIREYQEFAGFKSHE